jgi:hypothetical protein
MWYQNIWLKKTGLFLALAVLYALSPVNVQQLIGCFATGWLFVDISSKIFD